MAETRKQRTPGAERKPRTMREKAVSYAGQDEMVRRTIAKIPPDTAVEDLTPTQKMLVGHEQAEAARLGALGYVPEAMAAARAVHARLEDDMEVLSRYNLPEHPVFTQMRENSLKALKGLELANEHALQLRFNDGCLSPPNRRHTQNEVGQE